MSVYPTLTQVGNCRKHHLINSADGVLVLKKKGWYKIQKIYTKLNWSIIYLFN